MKVQSLKFKITCWYTSIIILVFAVVFGAAFIYSELYSEAEIKEELEDEVKDLQEDILNYTEYFPDANLTAYYDDGVMLSIYSEDFEMINGILPDEFPTDISFEAGIVKRIEFDEDHWFILDGSMFLPDGTTMWVRGVHSYSSIATMFSMLLGGMGIIFPALVLVTALVGHQMIKRSLQPAHAITAAAKEISNSSTLSNRIPLPKAMDEFYEMTDTFNQMIGRLEQNFLRERQFSSDAAHELRTPVSVILSHCEYCLEELELPEKAKEEILIIQQKAQQMSELVSRLLMVSREERKFSKPEFEDVDLEILAESVTEELEEKAEEKDIHIEVLNYLSDTVMRGDMSMLTRLFINLTDNAIVYGRKHGYVKIILEEQAGEICLKFQDNGIGMPVEIQDKIWNRFFQADPSRSSSKGFGLGLFMVKQIVDCHKGTVAVESESGVGSTFIVLLPKNPEETA